MPIEIDKAIFKQHIIQLIIVLATSTHGRSAPVLPVESHNSATDFCHISSFSAAPAISSSNAASSVSRVEMWIDEQPSVQRRKRTAVHDCMCQELEKWVDEGRRRE